MRHITGLIGREELIEKITREARKGRHLLLTGPVLYYLLHFGLL